MDEPVKEELETVAFTVYQDGSVGYSHSNHKDGTGEGGPRFKPAHVLVMVSRVLARADQRLHSD